MKLNKKLPLLITMILTAMLCISGYSVTVSAQTNGNYTTGVVTATKTAQSVGTAKVKPTITQVEATPGVVPSETTTTVPVYEATEAAVPLSPEGNLTMVDDISGQASGGKQFITVMTKAGKTFYIIIDKAADKENVYFLNMVDEADLLALIDDKDSISVDRLTDNAVSTEPEPIIQPVIKPDITVSESKTEQTKAELTASDYLPLAVIVILMVVGAALWFIRSRKKKANVKGRQIPDEYIFDDEDDENFDKADGFDVTENKEIQEDDRG